MSEVTREKALEIIRDENLKFFNWFDDHEIKPDEVGISQEEDKWTVYSSDERANPVSEKEFYSESEALDNYINRLRATNKYNSLYKK